MLRNIILLLLFLQTQALVSCSRIKPNKANNEANDPATRVKGIDGGVEPILLRIAVPNSLTSQLTGLVDAYEQENNSVKVELLSLPTLLMQYGNGRIDLDGEDYLTLAQQTDLFYLPATPEVVQKGIVADLSPLFEQENDAFRSDFLPQAVEMASWDGGLWSLPVALDARVFYYNQSAFDAANLPYPALGWTWQQFDGLSQSLTNGTDEGWGYLSSTAVHAEFVLASMSPGLTEQQLSEAGWWEEATFQQALANYVGMFAPPEPIYGDMSDQTLQAWQTINEGKVALWDGSLSQYNQFSSNMEIGVVPFPISGGRLATTPLFVNGISMSAGTLHKQAAWDFLSYLSGQTAVLDNDTTVPARRSVAKLDGYWESIPDGLKNTWNAILEKNGNTSHFVTGMNAVDEAINKALHSDIALTVALDQIRLTDEAEATELVTVEQPDSAAEPPSDGVVTIDYKGGGDSERYNRPLVKAFEQDNPGIRINLLPISFDLVENQNMFAEANCFKSSTLADPSRVIALDPLIEADADLDLADFHPIFLEAFNINGVQKGLPTYADIYLIRFNKTLFDQAGVPYPQNGWRYDEFIETAVALTNTNESEKIYGFYGGQYDESSLLHSFLGLLGANLVDDTVLPATLDYTSAETASAMREIIELTSLYDVMPRDIDPYRPNDYSGDLRRLGKVAMWLENGNSLQSSVQIVWDWTIETGSVVLPIGNPQSSRGFSRVAGYFISSAANNEQRQACWQWVKYLTHHIPPTQYVPARRSLLDSNTYQQGKDVELLAAYQYWFDTVNNTETVMPAYGGSNNWLNFGMLWLMTAYDAILDEDTTLENGLGAAQGNFDIYRSCLIENDGFTERKKQVDCVCAQQETVRSGITQYLCNPASFFGFSGP